MAVDRTHNLDNALPRLEAALTKMLGAGAMILKGEMQDRAPELSGDMTRSVTVGEVTRTEDGEFHCFVGPAKDYSKYTEEERYIVGKQLGIISRAKGATMPWIKPAAEAARGDVQTLIGNAMRTTIRELQRGG